MNIAIIGAGAVGSAAARFLAQAGHGVTVFERFTLDHDRGSSYGSSRNIRRTYPDAFYTELLGAAYPLWDALEREAGEELFVRCGGLTFGRRGSPAMAQEELALRESGIDFDTLSAGDIVGRFPPFRLDADQYGLWQPESGFLRASECVRAQMRLALAAGATLRENTPVRAVGAGAVGRLTVTLADGDAEFDRVLMTAGPWMADFLAPLPLTVTRQYYAHLMPQADSKAFDAGAFPVWTDADANVYGFPADGDVPGGKVIRHERRQSTDPDHVRRAMDDADWRPLSVYVAQRLPDLQGLPVFEKTCLYTNTPDEDFIVDAVPGVSGAFLCSACSGHGFKFIVLLGQILANMALGEAVGNDLTRFRLARFGG